MACPFRGGQGGGGVQTKGLDNIQDAYKTLGAEGG